MPGSSWLAPARPDPVAMYRLTGPGGWLVTALQAHVEVWEVAVRYGAAAAAPSSPVPKPASSMARGQTRRVGGVVWLDDLAGALVVARSKAILGFSGPQVREEWKWLSLVRWAAHQPGAGRNRFVGAQPPPDRLPKGDVVAHRGRGVIPRAARLLPHDAHIGGKKRVSSIWSARASVVPGPWADEAN